MTADYAGLEPRVAELQRDMDAMNLVIGALHDEVRTLREHTSPRFDRLEAGFTALEARLAQHGEHLTAVGNALLEHGAVLQRHSEMLTEILRRLPSNPPAPQQ